MRDTTRLFIDTGEASLIVATTYAAFIWAITTRLGPMNLSRTGMIAAGAALALIPIGVATWWIFRKLQPHFTRREARFMAATFALFMPISFAMTLPFSEIGAGYAAALWESTYASLLGVFVVLVTLTTLLTFGFCALALWAARHIGRTPLNQ